METVSFDHGDNFAVGTDGRTVSVDSSLEPLSSSLMQGRKSLSLQNRFYEIELLTTVSPDKYVMLGTNTKCTGSSVTWNMHKSLRYRSLEGGVFTAGGGLRSDHPFGKQGDIITVFLEASFPQKQLINFFLNSRLVYRQWVHVPPTDVYPAIGVSCGPVQFRVTWPGEQSAPRHSLTKLTTDLSHWIGFRRFERDEEARTLKLVALDDTTREGYSIQAPRPLDTDGNTYFEVEAVTVNPKKGGVSIGLTPAWASKFRLPGCKIDTIGYNASGGSIYNDVNDVPTTEEEGLQCTDGDTVGCGILYQNCRKDATRDKQLVIVYFTKNKEVVHFKPRILPVGGFYPTVGMQHVGEKVKVYNPCNVPKLPPEVTKAFQEWSPLYSDFRFSEAISFLKYQKEKSDEQIFIKSQMEKPNILQYVKECPGCYCLRFKVLAKSDDCEIQVGVATTNMELQGEVLHKRHIRPACRFWSGGRNLKKDDVVHVTFSSVCPTQTRFRVQVNQRLVCREDAFHSPDLRGCPTICFQRGPAFLEVTWSDVESPLTASSYMTDLVHWAYEDCVYVTPTELAINDHIDDTYLYNVVAPQAVSAKCPFYFELSYMRSANRGMPTFPGIGVTSGVCPVTCEGFIMLRDVTTALFYGTSGRLITWKGGKRAKTKNDSGICTNVGCSISFADDKCVLQFLCNGHLVISHEMKQTVGGIYPVISFQPGSEGHHYKVSMAGVEGTSNVSQVMTSPVLAEVQGTLLFEWDSNLKPPKVIISGDTDETTDNNTVARKQGKLSSVHSVYICHCQADNAKVQEIMGGLQSKGYDVQTTCFSEQYDNGSSCGSLKTCEVAIVCLSPRASADDTTAQEVDTMVMKNIPILPVILEPSAWPPGGLLAHAASTLERYSDIRVDVTDVTLGSYDVKMIELNFHKAIGTSIQPVVLGPTPMIQLPPGSPDDDFDRYVYINNKNVPAMAEYTPRGSVKSSSCVLL